VPIEHCVQAFEPYIALNSHVRKPVILISLNPSPKDILSEEQMTVLAQEFMENFGYGNQPYIAWLHEDIDRKHMHIVSVRIDETGEKIDHNREAIRAQNICREMEVKYGLHPTFGEHGERELSSLQKVDYPKGDVKAQVKHTARTLLECYNCHSLAEYGTLLNLYNVTVYEVRGSVDGKEYHAPAGVAHYLEHKMFDLPGDRDVSAEFAALGASTNAFTSYDMTAYYFSCTDHFDECLRLLLEFVSTPYFTEESVEKERGIIDQEIGMNEDAPDSVVFDNLMAAMYAVHPIRQPILGTSETIREITPEVLYTCHRAFYAPGNMLLCVVGDVDPESVASAAREVLGSEKKETGVKLRSWQEEMTCPKAETECSMEVAMPTFNLAFKCEPLTHGDAAIREEMVADLAAEALFGESSELYLRLYEEGIIDSSFGGGFETVDGCAMLLCSGDSDDPRAVREAILEQAEKIAAEGLPEKAFLRMKRSALGRRIRGLDSFDSTCFRLCAYHFSDFDYFRFPEVYRGISAEEICDFLRRAVRAERCSLSVIYPVNKEAQS